MPDDLNTDPKRYWRRKEALSLEDVEARLATLESRAGGDDQLTGAVARVLVEALREARARDPDALANALAPLVVKSIRSEVLQSRDEVVDALYPLMGRMVRASVENALRELNQKIERALPLERWWIAAKAKFFGAPPVAVAASDGAGFTIDEALIIDRHTGAVLSRRALNPVAGAADEDMVGAMLAAVTGFAEDAFGDGAPDGLRRLRLTDSTVFLRASPGSILALRARGEPPAGLETRLDRLFETFLERRKELDATIAPEQAAALALEDVSSSARATVERKPRRLTPLAVVAVAITLTCAAFWAWSAAKSVQAERWRGSIERIVFDDAELRGYPVNVRFVKDSGRIVVMGLAPDSATRARLETRVRAAESPFPIEIEIRAVRGEGQGP